MSLVPSLGLPTVLSLGCVCGFVKCGEGHRLGDCGSQTVSGGVDLPFPPEILFLLGVQVLPGYLFMGGAYVGSKDSLGELVL